MFSAICLIAAAAMLAWIVRYRVHIHIEYQPRTYTRRRRHSQPQETAAGHYEAETVATLTDALVSLGATRKAARTAAREALAKLPGGKSDELLRIAIQQATTKGMS